MLWSFPGIPEDSSSSPSSSSWWRCYIWGSERESLLDAHHQLALLTPKWLSLDVHHHHHHHNDCDDRDDYQKLPLMIMILSPIYQYLTQSKDIWLDQTNILNIRLFESNICFTEYYIYTNIVWGMATCGLLYGERAASLLSYSPIDRKIALCIAAGTLNAHSVLNIHCSLDITHCLGHKLQIHWIKRSGCMEFHICSDILGVAKLLWIALKVVSVQVRLVHTGCTYQCFGCSGRLDWTLQENFTVHDMV